MAKCWVIMNCTLNICTVRIVGGMSAKISVATVATETRAAHRSLTLTVAPHSQKADKIVIV